jgi:regulator of sigma E protease
MFENNVISPRDRLARGLGFLAVAAVVLWLWPMAFVAIVAMGAIITVHELGHFTVCKLSGIRVETFSIGFGAPLLSLDRGGTRYQVAAIPLGGYVKPAGEFEEKEETAGKHAPDEFLGKPWYIRAAVLAAGPAFNFIFPVVFLFLLYASVGIPFFIAPPLVMDVSADSAAQEAGLKKGDQILKVDGEWTFDIKALVKQIDDAARRHPGKNTMLSVLRQGKQLEIGALSRLDPAAGRYRLGVEVDAGPAPLRKRVEKVEAGTPAEKAGFLMGDELLGVGGKLLKQGNDFNEQFATASKDSEGMVSVEVARLGKTVIIKAPQKQPLPDNFDPKLIGLVGLDLERDASLSGGEEKRYERVGIWRAAQYSFYENLFTVVTMAGGLVDLVRGKIAFKESVGGPVAIVRMAHQQAQNGFFELLQFMMRISLILGLMNLLPIPVLDGGTMMICIFEGLRRKPLSFKVQSALQNIFGALLISLMLFATYNDIANWFKALTNR